MSITKRSLLAALSSAAAAVALSGGLALAASPVASANGTPNMNIDATGGDNTAVDHDGTVGSFSSAVQGVVDPDGDQDATLIQSEEAVPQDKAATK